MSRASGDSMSTSQARAAEPGSQRLGRDLLFALHAALRALKLYPLENQAVQNALQELHQLARRLGELEQGVEVQFVGDVCFVNDTRLRIDLTSYATFGVVERVLSRHGIGHLKAEPGSTREEWANLLLLLTEEPTGEDAFEHFRQRLAARGVQHIEVGRTSDAPPEKLTDQRVSLEAAKRTYKQSVSVARDAMLGVRMGKGASVRRIKRAVQNIVDQVLDNETSMIGMTVLRDYDNYTFMHSVNVAIFSIALGKKLGLNKHELYELGFGALMHDVGKMKIPIEITNKTGPLDDREWKIVQDHPTEGLLELLEMDTVGDLPMRAMLLAYEHHMKIDQTGYPRSIRPRDPTLFSRIVQVADGFDAATSKRSYQSNPWTPDAVLREMRDNPKRGYDPLLVKAFVSLTGFYPVGSVVILDTFELAVVVEASSQQEHLHQPVVKVIFDEFGMPLMPPYTLDLAEVDPATGKPRRTIIKTTEPERYGINVQEYFV